MAFSGNVTISVMDSESQAMTNSKTYPLTVVYPVLHITEPQSLPTGTVNTAYQSTTIMAAGGNSTYNWSAPGLPNGLSINPGTGLVSGTPKVAFNSTVTVTVSDTESSAMTASKIYSLSVVYPVLSVTNPQSLPGGTVNSAYLSTTIMAMGGNGNYTWSETGLPAGLSINPGTGVISGTPTAGGNNLSVTVTVTDKESPAMAASKMYSLTVVYPVLSVTNPQSLPGGTVGSAYPATGVTAMGGNENYSWSETGLPAGLGIDPGTGVISGTPTAGGTNLSVKVTVSDSELPAMTASNTYSLTVVYPVLRVTNPQSIPGGTVGSAYPSTTIMATGGNENYTWSETGLPAGLNINPGTGVISGTPSVSGNNLSVKVTVTDSESPAMTASNTYSLTVVYPTLRLTNPQSLPGGTIGSAYPSTTIMATGGNENYTWSETGLPNGLSIDGGTGVISGTPNVPGNNLSVTVTVTDSEAPPMTASNTYSLTVVYPTLSIMEPQSLPGDTLGTPYQNTTVKATGGDGSYSWSETGLPSGLSLNPSTGLISGDPSKAGSNLNVTVTVTDGESPAMTAHMSYTLTIDPAIMITAPSSLSVGTDDAAYPNTTVMAIGGNGNYTWSAPGLPNGLSIDAKTGLISGTPGSSFSGSVTVTVTDTESPPASTSKSYTLTINPELMITGPSSLPGATVNVAYPAAMMTMTGGTAPFTWSAAGLPAGLRIDPTSGNITGVPPTDAGSPFSPRITVQDAAMASAAKTYNSVTVVPGPPTVCQVTHTDSTSVVDIRTMIQEALGVVPPADIPNSGGVANVVGVQVVVDAAVGFGCLTTGTSSLSISVAPSAVSNVKAAPADLGTLGGSSTVAFAINDLGQVVGSSAARAFLWDAGRMTDVSLPLANAASSVAYGINGAGQVVGTYSSGSGDSAGFFSDRGIMFGIAGETARAINESGQVVGSWLADGAFNHAFLWDGGVTTDLGTLGGSESQACCINNTGLIAGSSQVEGDFAVHAFRYDGATLTDLGTLGGTESVATGINDAGQIVGYSTTSGNDSRHAFLYGGGLMMDLGTLGGARSQADGINQAGLIVGWAETADGVRHACLWSAGKVIDLNGAATVGLVEATAINDAGQIVANGANGRAYLIALPAH